MYLFHAFHYYSHLYRKSVGNRRTERFEIEFFFHNNNESLITIRYFLF